MITRFLSDLELIYIVYALSASLDDARIRYMTNRKCRDEERLLEMRCNDQTVLCWHTCGGEWATVWSLPGR